MDYAIVTKEWMTQRGLIIEPHMRTSVDNNKVVLHKSWLRPFLEDEGIELYYHDDPAFIALLASAEWTSPEGEIQPMNMGKGTKESPYTYDGVMSLVKGNYYSQDGVTYLCTRSLYEENSTALKDLVGMYVKEVTE